MSQTVAHFPNAKQTAIHAALLPLATEEYKKSLALRRERPASAHAALRYQDALATLNRRHVALGLAVQPYESL